MHKGKILLVDDEVAFTASMAKLLQRQGYQVKTVNSGEQAIGILEAESFDVVVLDLKMPGMDGTATLQEIQNLKLHIETLILTGIGSIDSALEAFNLGAYDYLTKPCALDELLPKIEAAMEKRMPTKKSFTGRVD